MHINSLYLFFACLLTSTVLANQFGGHGHANALAGRRSRLAHRAPKAYPIVSGHLSNTKRKACKQRPPVAPAATNTIGPGGVPVAAPAEGSPTPASAAPTNDNRTPPHSSIIGAPVAPPAAATSTVGSGGAPVVPVSQFASNGAAQTPASSVNGVPANGVPTASSAVGSASAAASSSSRLSSSSMPSGSTAPSGSGSASASHTTSASVSGSPASSNASSGAVSSSMSASASHGAASSSNSASSASASSSHASSSSASLHASSSHVSSSASHSSSAPSTTPTAVTRFLSKAPRFVVYSQGDLPTPSSLKGYNTFVLAFHTTKATEPTFAGPRYAAAAFAALNATQRASMLNAYHAAGISVMVSTFGYGDNPTSAKLDPVGEANAVAEFVKKYQLDGVDVDWEDFNSLIPGDGYAEKWLVSYTQQLRKQLPPGQYLLSEAPVAPWFTTNTTRYPAGAYRTVNTKVGNLIDFYNVQFYNQGSDYITCETLLTKSASGTYVHTSLFEIAQYNSIPLSKIAIGKPAIEADAASGYMTPAAIAQCATQAKAKSWTGGIMLWAWPDASASVISTMRKGTWAI